MGVKVKYDSLPDVTFSPADVTETTIDKLSGATAIVYGPEEDVVYVSEPIWEARFQIEQAAKGAAATLHGVSNAR